MHVITGLCFQRMYVHIYSEMIGRHDGELAFNPRNFEK